jgi:hypothetical protein
MLLFSSIRTEEGRKEKESRRVEAKSLHMD